jgi:hypothetical protein
VSSDDWLQLLNQKGKEKEVAVEELPIYNRGAKGAVIKGGIKSVQRKPKEEELAKLEVDGDSE